MKGLKFSVILWMSLNEKMDDHRAESINLLLSMLCHEYLEGMLSLGTLESK